MPAGVKIGDVFVEADLNDDKYRRSLRDLLDHTNSQEAEIGVGANTLAASAQIHHAARDRVVLFHAEVGGIDALETAFARLSGLRSISNSIDSITSSIGRLDQSTPRIAGLATGFTLLGSAVLAGSSNILTLGGSLASIVPAALALPGIFGGIAIGVGVTIAALKDIKTVLADLGPVFAGLQDQISANFWAAAAGPIRQLTYDLLPQLTESLGTVSTSLGQFFGAGADALRMSLAGGVLNEMMGHLATSIDVAKNALVPLVNTIVTLGQHGSAYLPRLAQWFVDITTQFNNFIQKAEGNGSLERWTNTGIAALGALGNVIKNTATIFYGLYTAAEAAGGASLQNLADGLGRISTIVNGPAFQGALTTIFQGAHLAMEGLMTALGPLGDMFVALAPTLARIMALAGQIAGQTLSALATALSNPIFATGLNSLFEGILSGVQAILPAIPSLVAAFSSFMVLVGEVASILGPVLGTAIQALSPAFVHLTNAIAPVAAVLAGVLMNALTALAPVITEIAYKIADFATTNPGLTASLVAVAGAAGVLIGGLVSITPTLFSIISAVVPLVGSMGGLSAVFSALRIALAAITGPVGLIIAGFALAYASSEPFRAAINNLVGVIGQFVGAIVGQLLPIIGQITTAFMTIVETAIVPLVTAFTSMLIPVLQSLMPIVTTVFSFISSSITNAMTVISGIITTVTGLITGNWSMAWSGIQQIFSGVWAQITNIVQTAITLVGNIINYGISFFQNVTMVGLNAIANIFRSIWTGITSFLSSMWNSMMSTTANNINNIRNSVSNGFNAVRNIISTIMTAAGVLIRSIWSSITSTISNAVSNVRNAISNGFNAASSIVSSTMNTMRSIASSVFSSIVSTISSGVSSVRSFISNGFNAAVSTVQSAFSSMVSAASNGISNVMSVVSGLPGRVQGALGNLGGLLISSGAALMNGFKEGILGAIGSVVDAASSAVSAVRDLFPFSPAKKGPFSGKGYTTYSGKALATDFGKGITSQAGYVQDATEGLLNAASGTLNSKVDVNGNIPTSSAGTVSNAGGQSSGIIEGNTTYTGDIHLHFDGVDIDRMKSVIDMLESIPQVARAGGSTTNRKY